MKVVNIPRRFVLNEWGGTETVILETCKRLAKQGHDISIFTSMALAQKRFERLGNIPVKRFPHFYPYFGLSAESIAKLDKKGGNLFSFELFNALLKEKKLDLIHLHTGKRMGGIASTAAKLKGIPYVISLHGGFLDVPAEEAKTWTDPTVGTWEWGKALGALFGSRKVLENAAAIICVNSDEAVKLAAMYPDKRVEYLPNGVDTEKFARPVNPDFRKRFKIPQEAFVILTCGRIDPQKNQWFLASQLPEILKIRPDTHIVFLGPSTNLDYEKRISDLQKNEPFKSRLHLLGGRPPGHDDLYKAYHSADLFVLPSVHEPFGIVILEAWAAGLPVIASRTGGIPAFVENETDGLLFPPNDADSFLQCFKMVAQSGNLAKKLSENGLTKAKNQYDWEIVTKRLEDLYKAIL